MVAKNNLIKIKKIVKKYIEKVDNLYDIKAAYIFGSYIKGNFNEDSDIDVLIVSDDFTGDIFDDTVALMKIRRSVDTRIEPHPFKTKDFNDTNPFIKDIKSNLLKISAWNFGGF